MKKKMISIIALVLVLGMAIGGTLAYLKAQSAKVTNTFVVGDIGTLKLDETDYDGDKTRKEEGNKYTIVPGMNITQKDPQVHYTPITKTDTKEPVDVYVFLTVTGWDVDGKTVTKDVGSTQKALSFTIADDWTAVPGKTGVYYKEIPKTATGEQTMNVIKDNKITVSADITTTDLRSITAETLNVDFQSYAIQKDTFDGPAAAYEAAIAAVTP